MTPETKVKKKKKKKSDQEQFEQWMKVWGDYCCMGVIACFSLVGFWWVMSAGSLKSCIFLEANSTRSPFHMTTAHGFWEMRVKCIGLHSKPMDIFIDGPLVTQLKRGRPGVINIGPNTLSTEEAQFLGRLKQEAPWMKVAFVEPNPQTFENLGRNLELYGISNESVKVIEAGACPDLQDRTLYRFSDESNLVVLGSNNITYPLVNLFAVMEDRDVLVSAYKDKGLWKNLGHTEPKGYNDSNRAADPMIENISVRCVTPQKILEEAGILAEEVAYLKMDAEGYDAQLLTMFLDVDKFSPALIQWEFFVSHDSHLNKDELATDMRLAVETLANRSYRTYMKGDNLVAVLTSHIHDEL